MARKTYTNAFAIPIPVDPVVGVGRAVPATSVIAGNNLPKAGEQYQIDASAAYSHPSSTPSNPDAADRYYTIQNADGRTGFLVHRTGGTGSVVLTLETYYEHDTLELDDKDITLAAGGIAVFGRLSPGVYNYPDGTLRITVKTAGGTGALVNIYAFTI